MFEFENGKTVKYDLSSGKTIGKLGKPLKSLNSQLRGYNVYRKKRKTPESLAQGI